MYAQVCQRPHEDSKRWADAYLTKVILLACVQEGTWHLHRQVQLGRWRTDKILLTWLPTIRPSVTSCRKWIPAYTLHMLAASYVITKQKQQSHVAMQHTVAMSTRCQSSMSWPGRTQIGTNALTHMQQQHASWTTCRTSCKFKLKSTDLKFD